ncbi:MAG: MFS transporter [Desulfotomaculaceae bacterium]
MAGIQPETGPVGGGTRFNYSWVILVTGILTVMGALGFARFGYATILPSMREGLLLNNTQMGVIATGNLVGYTVFSVIGGFLASRFGPRIVISCGLLLTGATMFLTGTAGGLAGVVALRFLTGIGSAGSNIPVMGLISAWFPPERRGMAAGFLVGGSGFGFLITGFLVPGIITAYPQNGWRLSWFILGGVVALLGVLGWILLRNSPAEKGLTPAGAKPDDQLREPSGTPADRMSEPATSAGAVNGRLDLAGGRGAISWSKVYGSPALWHLGLVYLFFGFSYIIYGTFFSAAMVNDKGFSQAQAGVVWSTIGVIGIFGGILWGVASDWLGRKYALAVVFGLQAVSFFLFSVAGATATLYLSAFLYGLSAFSIPGIVAAACGDYMGPRLAPAALGMVTLFFAVGQATAPSVAGYLADSAHSFSQAFLLAAAVAFLGGAGSLTLRPPKHKL